MSAFVDRLLALLYPSRCVFCHRVLDEVRDGVCPACRRRYTSEGLRRNLDQIALCVAPLRYKDQVRESLLRYKFNGCTGYAAVYAEFIAKCIDESEISCDSITWVPLSRRRRRRRGYDQAQMIAEETAKRLGLPCERLLEKLIDTKPQSGLETAADRWKNARGVYACRDPERVRGRRVLLIDDIVTSGATLTECASVLRKADCAAVYAACVASSH